MSDPATERIKRLLAGLTNYERTRPHAVAWSLEPIRALLAREGARSFPGLAVQIGGSKGKGSTAVYVESLARSAGLRVGTYLSPHVSSVLERIRLDGENVSEAELVATLEPILAWMQQSGRTATFFEVMTAAAAQIFACRACDLAIYEVGLGGRLDATTALPVAASILTTIELEHTQLLGDTVAAIAAEKVPIVRAGGVAFTAVGGEALAVARAHAARVGADLRESGRDFGIRDLHSRGAGFTGRLWTGKGVEAAFALQDAPAVELTALALAFACHAELFPALRPRLDPVPRPQLPGRCEIRHDPDGSVWILDGAHTAESLAHLAAELGRRFPGRRLALLFAAAIDKRWQAGLSALLPLVDRACVTRLADTASAEPDEIVTWLRARGVPAETAPDASVGLAWLARQGSLRLVTGSFYLVGAARVRTEAKP